ncbi:hypothetical protein Lal_00012115 [Lupinus albus]|nr:hypothetical protein Lal_00012115 [Lupinus albus]
MELRRLTLHEESNKKKKGISLKATTSKVRTQEEKSHDKDIGSSDIDETMALLVNKFSKFFKKKGAFRKFQ